MSEQVQTESVAMVGPAAGRRRSGADPETSIKGLAKTLARDATAQIEDRHVRAQVRAICYNQVVEVLLRFALQQDHQRERQKRLVTVLGAVSATLAAALAASLLI